LAPFFIDSLEICARVAISGAYPNYVSCITPEKLHLERIVIPRYFFQVLPLVGLGLLATGCKKQQKATQSAIAPAPSAAAANQIAETGLRFAGEVRRSSRYEKMFAPNMYFRLEPYAGNDSGWSIRIAPGGDSSSAAMDCIGAISEPLHGNAEVEIEPLQRDPSPRDWKEREFEYVAGAQDCKQAWGLANIANYSSKLPDKEREEASTKLGQIPKRRGKFSILDSRSGTSDASNERGTLEWLKFEVDLDAIAPPKSASIRSMDLKPFVESHLGELNPDLADLQTDCGEGQKPLQSLAPVLYGDLDGDGQEEAALEGWSCLSGNGGADFRGVIKLMPTGKLTVLPIAPLPKTFKGRDPYTGLRGHMVVQIEDGKLVELYGIYTDKDLNCCPEGGERKFVYRWDGQQFVLDDIIDVPPEKNENRPAN
jgi:hypothetical protein